VRIVIADDAALLRQGVVRLLDEGGLDVVGEASDAGELLRLVERHRPDVAIVDIRMPPSHTDEGLVAAQVIRRRSPETGVLVLSQYIDAAYALRLADGEQSRCGYLLKDRILDGRELVAAVRRVDAGDVVIDPGWSTSCSEGNVSRARSTS
jgi:DNA-binding NarL/FixJ family response regulator